MFSLLRTLIKISLFSGLVLIAGQLIHWNGRTISDQVRTGMSHAERAPVVQSVKSQVSTWWESLYGRVHGAFTKAFKDASKSDGFSQKAREARVRAEKKVNDLLDSERQELEELLKKPESRK